MKKPAIALCCAYLCLFSLPAGRSQENDKSPAPKLSKAPNADLSKEAIVYEQVREHLRYDADGTGSNDTYVPIRVQSYAGVQRVGQLIFNYDSANSKIEVRLIRVTKSNGRIVTAGPEAIQDMTSPIAQAAPIYTDLRQRHVVVPDLSPGLTFWNMKPLKPIARWYPARYGKPGTLSTMTSVSTNKSSWTPHPNCRSARPQRAA